MVRRSYILLLSSLLVLFWGCSEVQTDNPYSSASQIRIASSDILFDSAGGEGFIEVACDKEFQVSCDAPWVSFSVSGKSVKVTVEPLGKVNGRAATLLFSCGDDVAKAVVQQTGYVIVDEVPSFIELGDEAAVLSYAIDAPYIVTATSEADWIEVEVLDQKTVQFRLTENPTGWKRTGKVLMSYSDPDEDAREVTVTQFDFQQIAGEYELTFKDKDNVSSKETGELAMDSLTRKVTFTLHYTTQNGEDFDVVFPVSFSAADLTLGFLGGERVGDVQGKYLFCGPVSEDDRMTYGQGVGMVGRIERTVMSFGTGYSCKFEDNGVWTDKKAIAFSIAIFSSPAFASKYYGGTYRLFKNPTLSRFVLAE